MRIKQSNDAMDNNCKQKRNYDVFSLDARTRQWAQNKPPH